jgi:hemin uptake protein HemP
MTSGKHMLPTPAADPRSSNSRKATPAFKSKDLLGDGTVVFIDHQGERYRLQLTRQGKLILTK